MASITTAQSGAKKRTIFGAKKVRKKSAGRRRNGAISSDVDKAAKNSGVVLPRLEFEMALEVAGPGDGSWGDKNRGDENWTGIVRDAAEAVGGDLLFVLPYTAESGSSADATPIDHAMVRLVEDGKSRLLLVRAGAAGFHLLEEDAIDAGLARFARASIEVLERLGADKRIVAPLTTLARH